MPEETLKQKTAKGLFWGGMSNGVQQFLGMLFGIYLARILDAEDYGLVGMLSIFSAVASTIINSGFSVALTNKQNATHKDYNAVFWFTFFVGLLCYVILFFAAPLISEFYNRPELTNLSRVVFLSFFVSGCASVSYTILYKRLMVKLQAQIDITSMSISGIIGVILAVKGYAYWALALQSVVFIFLGALLRFIMASWRPSFEFDFKPLKSMFSFSVKLFFTNIFIQINNNVFSVLLGRFYSATQVGYYSQGYKWMGMGHSMIGGMINSVAQPVLVETSHDVERLKNAFRKMVRFGAFISFPLMLGLAYIGREFIIITIGEKWLPCVIFLQLFCIWGAIIYIRNLYISLLMTLGKSDVYMWGTILTGILQILVIVATLSFGIYAMVIGYIISSFIGMYWWQIYLNKTISLRSLDILKDIFPYFSMTVISFFITNCILTIVENEVLCLILKIILSGCFYISGLWLSNSKILKESIEFLLKKTR